MQLGVSPFMETPTWVELDILPDYQVIFKRFFFQKANDGRSVYVCWFCFTGVYSSWNEIIILIKYIV